MLERRFTRRSWCTGTMMGLALVGTFCMDSPSATAAGLSQGDPLGAFYVTKIGGGHEDGVEVGEDLCYRCRYGSRPMAIAFVRSVDGKVPELAKSLAAMTETFEGENFRALVTVLDADGEQAKAMAEKLSDTFAESVVPITVAKDHATGPLNYRIDADAEVTVVIASDSQVSAVQTGTAKDLDLAQVRKSVEAMLEAAAL